MRVKDVKKVERKEGVASTLNAKEFAPVYAERVEKFLLDNSSLGRNWTRDVASKLYVPNKNKDGEFVGSNPY